MTTQKDNNYTSNRWSTISLMRIPFVILSVALLIIVWFATYNNSKYQRELLQGQTIKLTEGWLDAAGNRVTLPTKLPYDSNGYTFNQKIDSEEIGQQSLLFYAKYLNVHIFLDNKEIGTALCRPNGENKTLGKTFVLIPLPDDMMGRTLRIEAEPMIGEGVKYEISAPRMGLSGLMVYEIVHNELSLLLVIGTIFCFGLFLLICGIQTLFVSIANKDPRTYHTDFLQIGLFAITFALYSLMITDTIYLFIDNPYYIYLMEFLLLALLPLPLLSQTASVCGDKYAKLLMVNCWLICFNIFVQSWLHFFAGVELRDIVIFTHILIVIAVLLIVPAITLGIRKGKDRWWQILSFTPILVCALMDIFRFYQPSSYQKATVFQWGVLLFLLLQTIYLIQINLLNYEKHLKFSVYQQLAYTDALTGLSNRTAFEEKLEELRQSQKDYSSIWCISVDVNNLKKVNDTLGHTMGDELIRGTANTLNAAAAGVCRIYRIGGDEFVLILYDQSKEQILEIKDRFETALEQYNDVHELKLSVALGWAQLGITGVDTIDKLISRADALMYEDKRAKKRTGSVCL